MIYGAILDKGEPWYTDMSRIFAAMEGRQNDYNWLVTAYECYPSYPETQRLFDREYLWLSGKKLTEITAGEPLQWVWGVFSGFPRHIPLTEVLKYPLPHTDGYECFLYGPLSIQNPLAEIAIVPMDSTLTLLFSRTPEWAEQFRKAFPLSRALPLHQPQSF